MQLENEARSTQTKEMNKYGHSDKFFCLCPVGLAAELNFNISKVVFENGFTDWLLPFRVWLLVPGRVGKHVEIVVVEKMFPRSFCLRMQQYNVHMPENVLLTIHCHELWKQQIQISPNRSSARNIFFIILKVKLSVCTKRVENTQLASNENRV